MHCISAYTDCEARAHPALIKKNNLSQEGGAAWWGNHMTCIMQCMYVKLQNKELQHHLHRKKGTKPRKKQALLEVHF